MTGPIDRSTPAVILGAAHHGGLGIARSLGRLGVPVYGVDSGWQPAFQSRYCRRRFDLPVSSVAALLEIGHKIGGQPVLIPTSDREAIWVAEHAEALRDVFRFQEQKAGLVRLLCDKGRMQDLARWSGVPVAQSIVPRTEADVIGFLETALFPVVVKSTDTERFRERTGGTKFIIHTRRELLDLFAKAQDGGGPNHLIQEFVPGEDWMFDGYFSRKSECLFGVTGKKIRRFPARTGVTSLGVCLRNEAVHKATSEFMKAIGYQGILDIGFRLDRRDGKYKVLDVNPRIGCTFRLFAAPNGMDVARALYLDLTGQAVVRSGAVDGRKWLVEDFDLLSALTSFHSGELSLKEWAGSFRGVQEFACFALDDPLPFVTMWASDVAEFSRWVRRRKGAPDSPATPVLKPLGSS